MKKLIFLLLITQASLACYSQPGSFLDTNKLWSVLRYPYMKWPNHYTHFLKIGNDTTMNDTVFSKLLRCDEESQTNWYDYGYLREDSTGKVFYRIEESPPEGLIYYDSAEVGDTLNVAFREGNKLSSFDLIVGFIDSVELSGNYYKKINFLHEQWIVDIGAKSGLIYNYTGLVGCDGYLLLCFKNNDSLIYKRESLSGYVFDDCYDEVTDVKDIESKKKEVLVYPNPSIQEPINIQFNIPAKYHLLLTNYLGNILIDKYIIDKKKYNINTGHLTPGIYFMTISDHSEIMFNEKIIIF